jgi:hypothetical protein
MGHGTNVKDKRHLEINCATQSYCRAQLSKMVKEFSDIVRGRCGAFNYVASETLVGQ